MVGASKITRTNTHVRAIVYRHDADPVVLNGKIIGSVVGPPGAITGLTSQKALAGVGQFSLTVKASPRFNVGREIQNGDWVVWWWEINGRGYHGSFGPVVSVGPSTSSSMGATVEEWTIAAADFSRVIERTKVWFDDFSEYENNIGGKRLGAAMGFTPTGSPDSIVEQVLDAFLGKSGVVGGAWKMPRGMSWLGDHFVEGLRIISSSTIASAPPRIVGDKSPRSVLPNGIEVLVESDDPVLRGEVFGPEISIFQPQPGTVLSQHLTALSNDLLNELFYDVLTESETLDAMSVQEPLPCVYVRERPFPFASLGLASPWFKLPTVRLDSNDGVMNNARFSSADERVNLIMVYASSMGQLDQYALNPPAYNRKDIEQNGICIFERSTPFAGFGESGNGISWGGELLTWHKLLASWYGLNHRWLSGNVSVRGVVPKARVGRRLLLNDSVPDKREQFYIEAVAHQWRYPQGGTTSMSVTRGWRGSDEELVSAVSSTASAFQREARGNDGLIADPVRPQDRLV